MAIISIIMPVFNAERYIITSVESVMNQSHKDWELIIINDGSKDDSDKIIRGFRDPRIRYFPQDKNKGVSAARNIGLRNMSGDYFCFLDADDYLPPGSLENRYKKFLERKEVEFVDGISNIYDKELETKLDTWQPSFSGNPFNELLNLNGSCFFGPTWMLKRNKNIDYQFNANLSHGEDLLFFIEIARHGGIYDYVNKVTLHYRKGHISAMKDLRGLENGYHYIYNSIKDYIEISPGQLKNFKRSAKKTLFKSYLGNYQPINALSSIFRKW
jgi:glycosyltransferase involved in cell wall biosynthesis